MIELLITVLIAAIVLGLVWYVVQQIPLPPPIANIIQVVVVVIFCLIVILLLLRLLPGHGVLW